jgi:hypothetical protein
MADDLWKGKFYHSALKNNGARASTPAMRAGGSRTAVSFIPLRVTASAMSVNPKFLSL